MAKRYQPQALLSEQGGVQTFSGRDALNGLPVRLYSFMGEPTGKVGELTSPFIPPILEATFSNGAGEVVTAFAPEFQPLRGPVAPQQVELLLRQTAAALDDAARAGVVHGDLSPERVLFDREAGEQGRFLLEGYGVPWRVRASESSPPERIGGATFAGDLFSWAMTVRRLSGPLPGDLRDLLARCLSADPQARPRAREVRAELDGYAFGRDLRPASSPQARRDESPFERFAADAEEHPPGSDDDLTPHETSGWHIPLRDVPPSSQQEVPPDIRLEPQVLPAQPSQHPAETSPLPLTASQPSRPAQLEPTATGDAAVDTRPAKTELPPESLRRTDETSAYRARRDRYQSGQGSAQTGQAQADQVQAGQAQAAEAPAPPHRDRPPDPVSQDPSEGDLPEVRSETSPAFDSENRRRRRGARSVPGAHTPARAPAGEDTEPFSSTRLEPVPPAELEDDFEVIDDIDDRAPDPTRSRGGLRVLLTTLLVIAILVLLALQFV